jgi:hypothetical protein
MAEAPVTRPAPIPDAVTKPFWDGTVKHELLLPTCRACGKPHFYPRPICPYCGGKNLEWVKASGKGKIYSYAIQYRPLIPGLEPPFVTAIIELDEGVRMLSNLVGIEPKPENIQCDMRVEVTWQDLNEEVSLPLFKPVS